MDEGVSGRDVQMTMRLILSFGAIYISLSLVYFLFQRWEMAGSSAALLQDPLAVAGMVGLVAVIVAFGGAKRRWNREDQEQSNKPED